jgi:integrase
MKQLVEQYINDHSKAWAKSTLRSERNRLNNLSSKIDGDPEALWNYFEEIQLGKYARTTYWTRVSDFWDWLIKNGHEHGPNPYAEWRTTNALQFKYVYERRSPSLTFDEARRRVETIGNLRVREACQLLLEGGLRYCEIGTLNPIDRTVIGKGSKPRRIYSERNPGGNVPYHQIHRALRSVGLRPHDLRKLAASRFREIGLKEEDLCQVMGWESFETAKYYLKPKKESEIEALLKLNVS